MLDIFPTLAERFAPGRPVPAVDGYSFAGVLSGSGSSARRGRYVYYPQLPQRSRGLPGTGIYAARAGQWKVHWAVQGSLQCGIRNVDAVCTPDQPYELLAVPLAFDVEADPGEDYPLNATDPAGG